MEALNEKERNSAILRFSMWLIICVIIICLPVILSSSLSSQKKNLNAEENANELARLNKEIGFVKDTFAVNLQKIQDLLKNSGEGSTDVESFVARITNIGDNIMLPPVEKMNWEGTMNSNLKFISEYLKGAYKSKETGESDKAKLQDDLRDIMLELEGVNDQLEDLSNEMDKKVFHSGVKKTHNQYKKALKMLQNFQSEI